ncbi:MAG: Flp family type IVb pilin [Defluviicoccus sp.]
MVKSLKALIKDESGATAVEYGLLLALISLALIGGAQYVAGQLDTIFTGVGDELGNHATPDTGTAH